MKKLRLFIQIFKQFNRLKVRKDVKKGMH